MMRPEELRAALDELDLSRRQAADALGVSKGAVRHWLSGRHAIPGPAARLVRLWLRRSDLRPRVEDEIPAEEVLRR